MAHSEPLRELDLNAEGAGGDLGKFLFSGLRVGKPCRAYRGREKNIPFAVLYKRVDPNAHFTHAPRTAPRDND